MSIHTSLLQIGFDPELPISAHVEEITSFIARHQVIIVQGETGSGKTTQLPKICLQMGRTSIGHTQPRRVAARSVATRIAEEIGVELGETIGYQVRFTRKTTKDTRCKVMTDGVLLAEITHDRWLRRYDTIIIDEAHERSLTIDFLLGYVKQLCQVRPELKVIITSATIDAQRFSEHFNDAPIISVSGRTYPVEKRYRPLDDEDDINAAIVCAARELVLEGAGDILVFLSGEREIKEAAEALQAAELGCEILQLFARLSMAEQQRVFASHVQRRIIVATNVAETSLTVPGIRYVIDTGFARISRYSARTKVQRLPIEPISRASADQRAGRCGRLGPGICIRLYSEDDYLSRPEFTEPEILRTNLASVILQMAQANLGSISDFDFIDSPDVANITDGIRLLEELGALHPGSRRKLKLTAVGRQLAKIPVDPRLGRMLIAAAELGCLQEMQVIVAGLSVQDVRERPAEYRTEADALHRRFFHDPKKDCGQESQPRHTPHTNTRRERDNQPEDPGGDFTALLRLWHYLEYQREQLSSTQFRKLCRAEYLSYVRVREWQDLISQLAQICKELGYRRNRSPATSEQIVIAGLSGLLSHVGLAETARPNTRRTGGRSRKIVREYLGARGAKFAINPGSSLAASTPPLVMAMELVETTRLWARTVAAIEASWIEQVGSHLTKSVYSQPHFSNKKGNVVAHEKVSIYGIPIIADRLVDYGRIHSKEAREIFIRSALMGDQWRPNPATPTGRLLAHNDAVRQELEEWEERFRRRDLIVDEQVIYDFFDARLPEHICSVTSLDEWLRTGNNRERVEFNTDLLRRVDAEMASPGAFPDVWQVGELSLAVSYVFEPGEGSDGVSVEIPLAQLNQVGEAPFTWQVPGLRQELATELIKSLPKPVRKNFIPASDHAREALYWLEHHGPDYKKSFGVELARALRTTTGVLVRPQEWNPSLIPTYLKVNFLITDGEQTLYKGDDLAAARDELRLKMSEKLTEVTSAGRQGTSWIFGALPEHTRLGRKSGSVIGYPALSDAVNKVVEVVVDNPDAQARVHRQGIIRLLGLVTADSTRWVISHLSNQEKLALGMSPYPNAEELFSDARDKAIAQIVDALPGAANTRDEQAFTELMFIARQEQADRHRSVVAIAANALRANESARLAVSTLGDTRLAEELTDQLDNLIFDRFISFTRDPWYGHLPRYITAVEARIEAYRVNPTRDHKASRLVQEVEGGYRELCSELPSGPVPDAVDDIGFLIEEFRVQQFAQHLRTSLPVSIPRIMKAIEKCRQNLFYP